MNKRYSDPKISKMCKDSQIGNMVKDSIIVQEDDEENHDRDGL